MTSTNTVAPVESADGPQIDTLVAAFGELPSVAPVAMRVIDMTNDEDVSFRELTDVISTDPALASRLLRLANSAAYSRGQEVTSLDRAANLIGLRTLKMVTLGFTLVDGLGANVASDLSLVWRRSLATAALARRLAAGLGPKAGEEAFAAGLLSNVGKTILYRVPEYVEAVEQYGPWLTPGRERQLLGFTSDELTSRILNQWELPAVVTEAIARRHPADPAGGEQPSALGNVLRVADSAAVLLLADDENVAARSLDEIMLAAAFLGRTIEEVEELIETTGPELDELAGVLELESISPESVEDLMRTAQAHLTKIALDMATQLNAERQRNDELEETNQELATAASTDALTGLANRRTFEAFLGNQVAARRRQPRTSALGLIIIDLDHFKSINDTMGHPVGDEVLTEVGQRLAGSCRRGELVARVGGEEFALILPDTSPKELGLAAERFRALLADDTVDTEAGSLEVTGSLGAAWMNDVEAGAEKVLYQSADQALYRSKEGGRNQVTLTQAR